VHRLSGQPAGYLVDLCLEIAKALGPNINPQFVRVPAAQRFEYIGSGSRKFWEISVSDTEVTVRFGRIGTAGTEQTKKFSDATRARREADKLINEKLKKGYTEAD